jgi:hypothetical protein
MGDMTRVAAMVVKLCSEAGCGRPHVARGLCHRHYRAFLKAGGPRKLVLQRHYGKTPEERFRLYTKRGPGCWEWTGYKNAKGYGVLNLGGTRILAHRMAYQMIAEIPDGMSVLHRCDNPGCVKFQHLFLGTRAENNADMDAKGRRRTGDTRGGKNPSVRLTENDVRTIRESAEPVRVLAARYGVARGHIYGIKRRLYWQHLE